MLVAVTVLGFGPTGGINQQIYAEHLTELLACHKHLIFGDGLLLIRLIPVI